MVPIIPSFSPKFGPHFVRASGRPLKSHLVQSPGGSPSPWKMPWKMFDLTSIGDSQLPSMKHRLLLKSVESVAPMFADCLCSKKQQHPKLKNRQRNGSSCSIWAVTLLLAKFIPWNPLRYNIFRNAAEKTSPKLPGGFHIQRWSMDVMGSCL